QLPALARQGSSRRSRDHQHHKREPGCSRADCRACAGAAVSREASPMKTKFVQILVTCGMPWAVTPENQAAAGPPFVPNSQSFWDFSEHWRTNYGPAYGDPVLDRTNFLECTGQFALCFHSGPEPLPCKLTKDGRFANCTCDVKEGTNYVLNTAILNHSVY